jgi:hypothetical protein
MQSAWFDQDFTTGTQRRITARITQFIFRNNLEAKRTNRLQTDVFRVESKIGFTAETQRSQRSRNPPKLLPFAFYLFRSVALKRPRPTSVRSILAW